VTRKQRPVSAHDTARPRPARKRRPSGGERLAPTRNDAESAIAWLFNRRDGDGQPLISEAQFNAGEKLRADFWFAQMTPNVTQSWSLTAGTGGGRRSAPGAGADIADSVIAAAERVRRALAGVGPEHAGILIDVCCHLKGLEDVERRAGWPRRSAKIVLGLALAALARHYGFAAHETVPRAAAVRHWGDSGYRPSIDGGSET
jgi:hypothetical protein